MRWSFGGGPKSWGESLQLPTRSHGTVEGLHESGVRVSRFPCSISLPKFSATLSTFSSGSVIMSTGDLLKIQPTELKFPFELKKQSSCCMQLTNKTDQYVAFKVKTTNPKKYCVRPNAGVVLPRATCDVTVTMQAQMEAPPDMQCKDKFLLQSVIMDEGATNKDITPEMFNKAPDRVVEEFKLRVVYIPANPPSPVPEGSEEGSSPRSSLVDNEANISSLLDDVSRSYEESAKEKNSEASAMISKLTEEKNSAIEQNQKLRQELDLLRKEQVGSFSIMFVVLVGLLGTILGFLMNKSS